MTPDIIETPIFVNFEIPETDVDVLEDMAKRGRQCI